MLPRCPYYPGTYQREQPRAVLLQSLNMNVLPGQSAIFRIMLLNDANEEGSYNLYTMRRSGKPVLFVAALQASCYMDHRQRRCPLEQGTA
jgi:hypothetical protein